MAVPTGKLAFAYRTIAFLEKQLADVRAQLPSQGGEAVAWARQCDLDESDPAIFVAREEVQESGYVVALYTHPADQVEDDLTMVKVSRELLERALKADASIGANAIQLADGWNAMAELRALLAKP